MVQSSMGHEMIKMDMIWIAAASLLYPDISQLHLVSRQNIEAQVWRLFSARFTPVMIEQHLVSWVDRQADKNQPNRGGSRNRYLFKTLDGVSPSKKGDFRLYKRVDEGYDGWDKTGRIRPDIDTIPSEFRHLFEWFETHYYLDR